MPSLAWLLLLILLRTALAWGGQVASNRLSLEIKTSLRLRLYDHLNALGPAWLRRESAGDLAHLLTEGIEALDAYFSQYLPQLFLALCAPLIILAFVFPIDALTGLVYLLTAPLIPFFMVLIGNRANQLTQRQWRLLSRLSAYFLDVIQGLTTLKTLGYAQEQAANLRAADDRYRQTTMGILRVSFLSAFALEMLSTLSTAIVAVAIGLRLLAGKMSFEPAFFILVITPEFYLPLRTLGMRFHASMAGNSAAARIYSLLNIPAASETAQRFKAQSASSEPPEILFEEVTFRYPDGRGSLDGISFKLPKGKVTALVGPSGAGKSTIAGLLLGFMTPTSGRILVDGKPMQPGELACAWVPQMPFLFQDTVRANISLGHPEASLEQVRAAARLANADAFIQALPAGYDTPIGERGLRLSSGQAQRIALARAFLRDAPLLILDEAASSLDPESEQLIRDAVHRISARRTVLVIAHRLNTAAQADQVIVLEAGRIVEQGKHEALTASGGVYARMTKGEIFLQSPADVSSWRSANVSPPTPGEGNRSPATLNSLSGAEGEPTPSSRRSTSVSPLTGEKGNFAILIRLLGLLTPFSRWIALSILAGCLTVICSVGLMSASAYIISYAALQPSIAELQVAIVGVRFFGISRGVFRYLERLISHETTFRTLANLRAWFYTRLERLAPSVALKYHSADIFTRIYADLTSLESFFVRSLAPPLVAVLSALAAGVLMSLFAPSLATILLGFQAIAGIILPFTVFSIGNRHAAQVVYSRAETSRLIVDGIQGMPDLRVFCQTGEHLKKVNKAIHRWQAFQKRGIWTLAAGQTLGSGLAYLGMWAVLAQAIMLLDQGQLQPLALGVVALAALTSFEAVIPLSESAQQLGNHLAGARRLFDIIDSQPQPQIAAPSREAPEHKEIRFKAVSFHYPGETSFRLEAIDFSLPAGKRLAIVGPSGSGKTTLLNLLLRFCEPSGGEILFNGQKLDSFSAEALRRSWGIVWQQTYLFNTTLRENLLLAAPSASQSEIELACAQAQLADFVASLPQGYDTLIGEGGLLLSGGERQRLAIARALLKNPRLLILDEPTANLDPLTEAAILAMLLRLSEGRSLLLITHRLVGMDAFDEILVIKSGSIVERGKHGELLALGGNYSQLWEAQNQFLL